MNENTCIVCRHPLNSHIDEEDLWRCHFLGSDLAQCECSLMKNRAENKLDFYDYNRRISENIKELKWETGL